MQIKFFPKLFMNEVIYKIITIIIKPNNELYLANLVFLPLFFI